MGGSLPADFRRWHHRRNDADYRRARPAFFFRGLQIRVAQSRLRDWVGSPQSEFWALCLLPDRFCRRSLHQSSQVDAQLILIRRDRVPRQAPPLLLINYFSLIPIYLIIFTTIPFGVNVNSFSRPSQNSGCVARLTAKEDPWPLKSYSIPPPASSLPRKPRRMLERPPLSCLGDWPLFHLDTRA